MDNPASLTIELVPATCWYSNVRSNVHRSTWSRLQDLHFRQAGYRCQICDGVGPTHPVELHEMWDYDDLHHVQRLKGLIALCPRCHQVKHMGHTLRTPAASAALEHLARVNRVTLARAVDLVQRAFVVHRERSRHNWVLDISWLTRRHGIVLDASQRERGLDR